MTDRLRLRALWLALGWSWAATIVWLSLVPNPPTIDLEQGDKLGHLAGYGLLMFWFCQLYLARGARTVYAIGFAMMGIALEGLQGALGYRTYEPFDMLANALGVALGWGIALATGHGLLRRLEAALSAPRA